MIRAGPVLHGGARVSPDLLTATAPVSTLGAMTTAISARPRLRQVFPGGHLNLAPAPGDPQQIDTPDEHTAARLALALLIARHGPGPGGKYEYRYEALDTRGNLLAAQDDPAVQALASALRGTDLGMDAQAAALQAAGLAAG